MPFHPEQLEAAKKQIKNDLRLLDDYGSVKLYICFYDQFMIPDSEWKGVYPCSDKTVHIGDVIAIVNEVMTEPYIIRHNVINAQALPAFLMGHNQNECEKYVEVCVVKTDYKKTQSNAITAPSVLPEQMSAPPPLNLGPRVHEPFYGCSNITWDPATRILSLWGYALTPMLGTTHDPLGHFVSDYNNPTSCELVKRHVLYQLLAAVFHTRADIHNVLLGLINTDNLPVKLSVEPC